MDRLTNILDEKTKVSLAAAASFGITMTDINAALQALVALATLIYICSKIWKLWTRKHH